MIIIYASENLPDLPFVSGEEPESRQISMFSEGLNVNCHVYFVGFDRQ
jgi:hypothetical protein